MASKKTKGISSVFCVILGFIIGFCAITYYKLPTTDSVAISEEQFYSKTDSHVHSAIAVDDANISVHFLELGNKYTGDCTYIKTDTCDILIDCGSKSNSVSYVKSYLDQYVTDGTLEYVIITHAHQDHYAGFATNENVDSIFDLYECQNIITFSQTNQNPDGKLYKNYTRELNAEVATGAHHYTALECVTPDNDIPSVFDIGTDIEMKILNSYYYYPENTSSTENDYSVCTLITYQQAEETQINMLFTGDLESNGEEKLVLLNDLPHVDLYKAGHHGSKTSSSSTLMSTIQPKTVCVCCCAGSPEYTQTNANQFPTQEFINRVAPYTDEIYVTTLCVDYDKNMFSSFNGNIVYMCSSSGYNVECSNNKTILKESAWFKKNRTWPSS